MGGTVSASWAGEELDVTRPWKPPVGTAKTTMEVGIWRPWTLAHSRSRRQKKKGHCWVSRKPTF